MSKVKGFIYGGISAATFGLIPLFALPVMAKGMNYDSILCYRFLVAVVAIAGLMLLKKESFRVNQRELLTLTILGVFYAASAMFLFWSYELMAAGIAATILFLYPVFVAILMNTLFHEKISWLTSLAIAIALSGVAFLYLGDGDRSLSFTGMFIVLLSAMAYALYMIVINKSNVQHLSGLKITFYSMVIAVVLFFIKAQCCGGIQPLTDGETLINIFLLGFIPTVVSCVTMVYAVQYIGSTYTAVMGAMEPLTAVCIGVLVFHEPLTLGLAVGILLIIIAVTLIIMSPIIQKSLDRLQRLIVGYLPKR